MSGDVHVQFYEGLRGKFPRATRLVFCCELQEDANKIYRGLKGRTERFSLKMNVDKTKRINFSKAKAQGGERQGTFDFLGFTFLSR